MNDPVAQARLLFDGGYRPTSSRHRMVSRIDREDWVKIMARHHTPWDAEGEGMRWALFSGRGDYYRRVLSQDKIDLSDTVFKAMKRLCREREATHGWGELDMYVPLRNQPARAIQL